jgi:hypothetical protein
VIKSWHQPLEKVNPEGQTRYVIIDCVLSKLFKPGKKITVRLAVEDQLQMKHYLRPVVVSSGGETGGK